MNKEDEPEEDSREEEPLWAILNVLRWMSVWLFFIMLAQCSHSAPH